MKNERNNIEHIFKDKLQGLEVSPPEHLWANISQEITPKKEQKKPFLFWYIGGGIAASFLIFTTLFFNFTSDSNSNNVIVFTEEEYCPEERIVNTQEDAATPNELDNNTVEISSTLNKATTHTNNSNRTAKNSIANPSPELIEPIEINYQKTNTSNSYASAEVPKSSFKENTKSIADKIDEEATITTPNSIENENLTDTEIIALLNPEKEEEETKKEKQKRWSLQPQLATFAYNSNGSSINSNFKNNPQDTETDLSYGMRIAYQATPKISIRTGISNAKINISTSNIGLETSSNNSVGTLFSNSDIAFVNLNPSPTINYGDFVSEEVSAPDSDELTSDEMEAPSSDGDEQEDTVSSGSISQQIQYVEIPIEIAYKLLDKKIGINIIGGFSTFLLSKNESSFESKNNSTALGETSSLNNTSFSSNIGFSIDYSLINNLKFSLEPMLKFQLNSFDNTTDYQPYLIGISSGLKWNF